MIGSWSQLSNNILVPEYLKLSAILQTTPGSFTALFYALVSGQTLYYFLVFVVAAGGTIAVYLSLDGVERLLSGIFGAISAVQTAPQRAKRKVVAETIIHIGFRILALVAWVAYGILFIEVIVPFSALGFYADLKGATMADIGFAMLITLFLWLCVCVHTVFLRLFVLRPRVFGSDDIIAAGLE